MAVMVSHVVINATIVRPERYWPFSGTRSCHAATRWPIQQVLLLYSSDQLFGHASKQFFSDPGLIFFSIYGDFGELSEKLNGHVREELVGTIQ